MGDRIPTELVQGIARLNDVFHANHHALRVARTPDTQIFHNGNQIRGAWAIMDSYTYGNAEAREAITTTLLNLNEMPFQP